MGKVELTPYNNLCHDVRNATLALAGLIKQIRDDARRLEAKKQLKRIEQALLRYEMGIKQRELSQAD